MRLVAIGLILLLPIAAAQAVLSDPPGDQATHLANGFGPSAEAGTLCADPATDLVGLALGVHEDEAEVRVSLRDVEARPTCAGQTMPGELWRAVGVGGFTADGTEVVLQWAESNGGWGFICRVEGDFCAGATAEFHQAGSDLVWTFALASEPWAGFPGHDVRGQSIDIVANSLTGLPRDPCCARPVNIHDHTARLVAELR